jgi:hypothetical protein
MTIAEIIAYQLPTPRERAAARAREWGWETERVASRCRRKLPTVIPPKLADQQRVDAYRKTVRLTHA